MLPATSTRRLATAPRATTRVIVMPGRACASDERSLTPWLALVSLLFWLAMAAVAQTASAAPSDAMTRVPPGDALRVQVEDWLQSRHPWQGSDYQVTVTAEALDSRLRLPACTQAPELSLPAGQRIGARTTVMAACSAPSPWRLLVPARISAQARALVARQAIPAGTVLTPAQFETSWRDVALLSQGHVPPQALAGLESRQLIGAGSTLTRALVKPQTLIKRGQQVLLRVTNDSLSISMAGVALGDGGLGERITVRNLSSQKVLDGEVAADGSVRVAF